MQNFLRPLAASVAGGGLLAIAPAAVAQTTATAVVGQALMQVWGLLENGDATLSDNSLFDKHWFTGQAGQTVVITLTSEDFDTYLMVYDANGDRIAQNDDINEADKNSSVTLTLPVDGAYRIVANAFSDLGHGHYKLTVVTLPDTAKSDPGIANILP